MKNFDSKGFTVRTGDKGKKWVLIAVIAVLALILITSCFVVVPAGHTGVVVTLGKVDSGILQEGFHLKMPFVQDVVCISNKIQVQEVTADAVSKDLQQVLSSIAVNYRVALDQSAKIYQNVGDRYSEIILLPAIQESMKAVTAQYTAEELITKRSQIGEEVKEGLENKVEEYGIKIEKFNIVNFSFSNEFNAAIEAKQVAEQNLTKTRTEQEQALVIARAEAEKKIIAAEAEAKAILEKANADAEANRVISESIDDNLLDYLKIEKWDGKLPLVQGSEGNIIDLASLKEAKESE